MSSACRLSSSRPRRRRQQATPKSRSLRAVALGGKHFSIAPTSSHASQSASVIGPYSRCVRPECAGHVVPAARGRMPDWIPRLEDSHVRSRIPCLAPGTGCCRRRLDTFCRSAKSRCLKRLSLAFSRRHAATVGERPSSCNALPRRGGGEARRGEAAGRRQSLPYTWPGRGARRGRMAGKVILETGRLLLREFDEGDAADFYVLGSDPEVTRHTGDPGGGGLTSLEHAREVLLSHPLADYRPHGFGPW